MREHERARLSPDPVAPVGHRDQAAECHQYAAAPDPADERLVVHPHQPGIRTHRLAKRNLAAIPEMDVVARELYKQTGMSAKDIDAGIIYDAFTSIVMWQLESFGFCKEGESKDFVRAGMRCLSFLWTHLILIRFVMIFRTYS